MRRRVGRVGATRGIAEGGGWRESASVLVVDLRLVERLMRQTEAERAAEIDTVILIVLRLEC
jgi:class 3 adenylate cyclase